MSTCTLCGNEEIERPVVYLWRTSTKKELQIPFGRYCWTHKRKACLAKAHELISLEEQEATA